VSFYQQSVAFEANGTNYRKLSQTVSLIASRGVKPESEFLSPKADVYKNQSTGRAWVGKQHEQAESRQGSNSGDRLYRDRSRGSRNEFEQLRHAVERLDFT
jgi:hypothetical protein